MRIVVEDGRYPDRVTHLVGYGELQRQIVLGLDSLAESVHIPDCTAEIANAATMADPVRMRLAAVARRRWLDDRDTVYLHVASPDHIVRRAGRFNVALTMTERESLDHYATAFDWVGVCNSMDLVITPSAWNKAVFERHGIRNVRVCPLGADTTFYTPSPVRFLTILRGYGLRGSRANWRDIVDCFADEFGDEESVSLTVLSQELRRPFTYGDWRDIIRRLPGDVVGILRDRRRQSRIFIREGGGLSPEQMREVYRGHDCYISYSREGWGLPLVEAMACSLEVIACDYGAPMTYLSGSPARLFPAGRLSADNLKFEGGDLASLRRHMRAVYAERTRMRGWISRFSWLASVSLLRDLLRDGHERWLRRPTAGD